MRCSTQPSHSFIWPWSSACSSSADLSDAGMPTWQQAARIVVGAWLILGLGAYTVLGAGIFGQHLQAGPIWHGASLLIVVGVFGLALYEAYAALAQRAAPELPDLRR